VSPTMNDGGGDRSPQAGVTVALRIWATLVASAGVAGWGAGLLLMLADPFSVRVGGVGLVVVGTFLILFGSRAAVTRMWSDPPLGHVTAPVPDQPPPLE
jgi:hypothetical protein